MDLERFADGARGWQVATHVLDDVLLAEAAAAGVSIERRAIAEEDLRIRGPGEFLGTRQAGLPDLRNANIVRDAAILEAAKKEAFGIIEKDAELKELPFLKERLDVFWKGRVDLFKTG